MNDFQTPVNVCKYMASFLPDKAGNILEPTPGLGYLVDELMNRGKVHAPYDFFKIGDMKFDWVVMNPPFTPMSLGYLILDKCMDMTNNIIALMPWLTIINSKIRTEKILGFGLVSVTHLPRDTFKGSRVQTCILVMKKGHKKKTNLLFY